MKLIDSINHLKKTEIAKEISKKITEFEKIGKKSSKEIYLELCYCLLTANFNAKKSVEIQKKIGPGFATFSLEKLSLKLKECGHRFPNTRANFIYLSRKYKNNIKEKLLENKTDLEKREWLVKKIKGLGYKEASHFLRNIGYKEFAIIDFHIVDILVENKLITKPKTLTKTKYLEIENILKKLGKKVNLSLAELDLYLWFLETKNIYK
jgi:N-glycosylase/DNA lyase